MNKTSNKSSISTQVGLIGPTYVGKTTYFAVLDRALRDLDWRVEVQSANGSDDNNSFRLLNHIRRYMNQGYFPPKTPDQIPTEGLYFRISKENRVFELIFIDPPGEVFEPLKETFDRDVQKVIFESIQRSKGLLMLLDLEKTPHELMNIWHYSIESFISHIRRNKDIGNLIRDDKLAIPMAVVFTKADRMPWMARHRSRDANAWLKGNEGLKSLAHDIRRDCNNVRFFFNSAVGWNKGRPNCRVVIRPRELLREKTEEDNSSTGPNWDDIVGDLIPDPGESSELRHSYRERLKSNIRCYTTMPLFSDPLRITDHQLNDELGRDFFGVITLPGRNPPSSENERFLSPWNTVEPLLWAVGFDKT